MGLEGVYIKYRSIILYSVCLFQEAFGLVLVLHCRNLDFRMRRFKEIDY